MRKNRKPVIESVEFCYEGSGKQLETFALSAVKDYVQAKERNEAETGGIIVTHGTPGDSSANVGK